MSDLLKGLNDQQKEAVITTEGYVRVIAGAGTGKTRALTHRYAYLMNEMAVPSENILCVTFTNKAANEMKTRIKGLVGDVAFPYICTFHSFCVRVLRDDSHVLNFPKMFRILDEEDKKAILKECYERQGIDTKSISLPKTIGYIDEMKKSQDYCKYFEKGGIDLLKTRYEEAKTLEESLFCDYMSEQVRLYAFDFNDLINVALTILRNNEDIRTKWQKRLNYIMLDEFQDVDSAQYELATILSSYHKNLFIVGDPDQTIYTWRGARVDFILNFEKDFTDCKTIIVDKNYRSAQKVISASNALIKKNKTRIDKNLEAMRDITGDVIYYHAESTKKEAYWVRKQIESLIKGGVKLSDILILYRAHHVSRQLEEELMYAGIPYMIYSGTPFYGRKEVKDILSYLRFIIDEDDLSFKRIINTPKRQIGSTSIKKMQEYAEENKCSLYRALHLVDKPGAYEFIMLIEKFQAIYKKMSISELLSSVLEDSGYEDMLRQENDTDRLDNIAELKQSIHDYETNAGESVSLENYLNDIALLTNTDKNDEAEKVRMMTIHAAKGLESPYVFVVAMNEGIFPSKRSSTAEQMEEERRLAYVATTRAMEQLFLTDAEGMNFDDSFRYPSRFIFNAERVNIDYVVELRRELTEGTNNFIDTEERYLYAEKYKIGDKVKMLAAGEGEVLSVGTKTNSYEIKFEKFTTPRTISFDLGAKVLTKV